MPMKHAMRFFRRTILPMTQHDPVRVDFLIPDYRARIKELKIDGREISVSVDGKESDMDSLLVQIACKKQDMGYQHLEDTSPGNGVAKFRAEHVPDEVTVYLLNSNDGKIMDSKCFNRHRHVTADGVTVATSEQSLRAIISNGEDRHTEFKRDLDKKSMEFLESVVSFANTDGGKILLGVSDDGSVVGPP